jgi:hypothetical protein
MSVQRAYLAGVWRAGFDPKPTLRRQRGHGRAMSGSLKAAVYTVVGEKRRPGEALCDVQFVRQKLFVNSSANSGRPALPMMTGAIACAASRGLVASSWSTTTTTYGISASTVSKLSAAPHGGRKRARRNRAPAAGPKLRGRCGRFRNAEHEQLDSIAEARHIVPSFRALLVTGYADGASSSSTSR